MDLYQRSLSVIRENYCTLNIHEKPFLYKLSVAIHSNLKALLNLSVAFPSRIFTCEGLVALENVIVDAI